MRRIELFENYGNLIFNKIKIGIERKNSLYNV